MLWSCSEKAGEKAKRFMQFCTHSVDKIVSKAYDVTLCP
ncbi:hypothetical protein JAB1_54850 [Janthinobacterium sp. MP5059B]|nr:hypothetical protein JAB1_54850 [Janthinobacterium sp. MP5059B]